MNLGSVTLQRAEPAPTDDTDLADRFNKSLRIAEPAKRGPLLWTIKNAHEDDIHGFVINNENSFISGSKDSYVKEWNGLEGKQIKIIDHWSERIDYKHWVTAIARFEDGILLSGWRDGRIKIYFPDGWVKTISCELPTKDHISKKRNHQRINCLTALQDGFFYAGTPGYLHLYNIYNKPAYIPLAQKKISENDWVYCIHPLGERLGVVSGPDLTVWQKLPDRWDWEKIEDLVEEERSDRQRPHISSLISLTESIIALVTFEGKIRLINIDTGKTIANFRGHTGRAWSVVKIEENVIATSADDRTIKLWDIRAKKNKAALIDHPGRVSSLLAMSKDFLIGGSCPDKVYESDEKAEIKGWDLRSL